MPTVDENRRIWQETYDWSHRGDEWSETWGGEDVQWFTAILPRIQAFVTDEGGAAREQTILEIAPGFGRWTNYLLHLCQRLVVVDLAEKCIDACKDRFRTASHIVYHVNDGKSLAAIDDDSIDFVFSMDSLVHAEDDVIEAYLSQLGAKLHRNGVGFIHHSNLGEFRHLSSETPVHNRAKTMTAAKFKRLAEVADLKCLSQEVINWGTREPIDSLSVLARNDSDWNAPYRFLRNENFMSEASGSRRLSELYGRRSLDKSSSGAS